MNQWLLETERGHINGMNQWLLTPFPLRSATCSWGRMPQHEAFAFTEAFRPSHPLCHALKVGQFYALRSTRTRKDLQILPTWYHALWSQRSTGKCRRRMALVSCSASGGLTLPKSVEEART